MFNGCRGNESTPGCLDGERSLEPPNAIDETVGEEGRGRDPGALPDDGKVDKTSDGMGGETSDATVEETSDATVDSMSGRMVNEASN